MKTLDHVMILASAGSGKTYALTNRFVRLLAMGAKPERIVALTFTRKAAGEFFEEIIKKLARAASESAYATQLAVEIGSAELDAADFLKMLREVVRVMHRLQLGTFDGFFARIARNFPFELGLSGEFEILQEHAKKMERTRVLRRMFERRGELGQPQREFIEAFKRATFGADEKRLGAQLDAFLDAHHEIYLAAPHWDYWGNAARIWPAGGSWTAEKGGAVEASFRELQAWVASANLPEKQRTRWEDFLRLWHEWSPGVVPERALTYVLEKSLSAWNDVEAGRAVLEFDRKKQTLSPAACAALADLTRHVVATELERRLEVTRGIHAVLRSYEGVYHDAVRRAGKLTFGDVQRLLVPAENGPSALSRDPDDDRRLFVDFRLDAEIDHWLLDEFQDTSFGQWSVLRNLIDEVLQDPTGQRSFFYVGDVKQAIFSWREGDPRLFREIFDRYNAARPGLIAEQHLVKSWRSGPAVIETVNQVFGDASVIKELFPGQASLSWNREWRTHESERPNLSGQVALLHAEDERARFEVVLKLLEEIEPLARGLSCGILVQTNAAAATLANYLRQEGGVPAVADSDLHVCIDNPLGCALLAMVKAAAHPGDTLAVGHLRMTPLWRVLNLEGIDTVERVSREILTQIHVMGFERSMAFWIQRLEAYLRKDDEFSRQRARQFAAAAGSFDTTGSRSVAEFIQFMERHVVRDTEGAADIRVMTVHKAKGLGFDLVLLPDLDGTKLDCRREGLAVQKSADRSVEWIFDLPGKLFYAQDEVLSKHVLAAEADACYESLSLLYVGMTRAKHAMYIIAKPSGTSTSRNYVKLLAETLGETSQSIHVGKQSFAGAYGTGSSTWFSNMHSTLGEAARTVADRVPLKSPGPRRLQSRRPSGEHLGEIAGGKLFSLERSSAKDFGTIVHELLAEVEWGTPEAIAWHSAQWRSQGRPLPAIEEAIACVKAPELAGIWVKPEFGEVWRERSFEIVMGDEWVTGVFDRVVLERTTTAHVCRVTVIDFKTDQVEPARNFELLKARYTKQLSLYRRVAAVLAAVEEEHVECRLVLTKTRSLVALDPSVSP